MKFVKMATNWFKGECSVFVFMLVLSQIGAIFQQQKWLDDIPTNQRNYGVAVSDVNHDGRPDFIVAGYSGANFVLVYNKTSGTVQNIATANSSYSALIDRPGNAIGVTACDIDGDGKEEIYFLNTNQAYAGRAAYGDKIFKWRNDRYEDLYSDSVNVNMPAKGFAGRSVACVDRLGTGKYAFILATYASGDQGQFALIEMDESHPQNDVSQGKIVLRNVGRQSKIARKTGGRGIAVGPIFGNNGRSDIFFGNEGNGFYGNPGDNFLFMNLGDGTFRDIAGSAGIQDGNENVRGIALGDFNKDGLIDVAYGNWVGPHRLYLQRRNGSAVTFENRGFTNQKYSQNTAIRTVIAADFDNDGNLEIFQNNIVYRGAQPNKVFTIKPAGDNDVVIEDLPIGDALEPNGYGTGAAVTDFDGDGKLELLISHGESNSESLSIFKVSRGNRNNWIRIHPKTRQGAPARGAAVKILTNTGVSHLHVIDGGSGYLCEMEPYAHIGLGDQFPAQLSVQWPGGEHITRPMTAAHINQVHVIEHPGTTSKAGPNADNPSQECPIGKWKSIPYRDFPVLCEDDRVTRGPGWRWGNEDNGSSGRVIRPSGRSYLNYYANNGDPHWVMVQWDFNGVTLPYRMGSRDIQDLCRCTDCGVDPRCGQYTC